MIIGSSIVVCLLLGCTCYYILRYYHYVSAAAGKSIAIYTAMSASFVVGVNSFTLLNEPLLSSSILAACTGLGIGWLIGIPFSFKAIAGGVVSGLAASGSFYAIQMFWEYQNQLLWFILVGFAFFFSSGALFKTLKAIPNCEQIFLKGCIQHPILIGPLLVIVFWFYQFIEKYMPQSDPTRKV
ncbi:hypothetical protein FZC66_04920 [Priestia megaterium]|nr:hypothetical protein FZC66_04920 [Priestia megaterium]